MNSRRIAIIAIACTTVIAAVYGWKLFWFLTDDSYIAFRYVSNSLAGRGLVWNPAPFRPVEGYTSLLWVLVLREVWRFTGIEPPESANVISLFCGLATLMLGFWLLLRMSLPAKAEGWRLALAALALLGTVTNRTFLAWLSSGMETALFNLIFTAWVVVGVAAGKRGKSWALGLSTLAALSELCRPDGLLIVAATAAMIVLASPRLIAFAAPLLAVPAHILWRWRTYGDWLPNTYRAKYGGPWPEAGWRYLACFVVENGTWFWPVLAGVAAFRLRRELRISTALIPVAVVAAHAAYYAFIIGGDHFEYRVYSHLILLLFISGAWLAARIGNGATAAALLAIFVAVSEPIPWVHWSDTHNLRTRAETKELVRPIAQHFPWPAKVVVAQWDGWQAWLIHHFVGMRHQEHKVFEWEQARLLPTREEGERTLWTGNPVAAGGTVGVPGWVMSNVAVIDMHGLNDWAIARTPALWTQGVRKMAHEHVPPEGYVSCFRPNVSIENRTLIVTPRAPPLTDDDIRGCEAKFGRYNSAP